MDKGPNLPVSWYVIAAVVFASNILEIKGAPCHEELDFRTRPPNLNSTFNMFWIIQPQCPKDVGVTFTLYTRNIPKGEQIRVIDKNMLTLNYRVNKDSKILIHGLNGDVDGWIKDATHAFLKNMDVNVITVDWKKGSSRNILTSNANLVIVGQEIAYLIQTIIAKKWNSGEKFHLIGHSLGAHAAGFAGERVPGLGRITGLDPSPLLFGPWSADVSGPDYGRLDCTDAQFVDIIHTFSLIGIERPSGHLDFYPNGGYSQPGCNLFEYGACSHVRATAYFVESINPSPFCKFTAVKMCKPFELDIQGRCLRNKYDPKNYAIMGMDADKYAGNLNSTCGTRKFHLRTNRKPPYCRPFSLRRRG